MKNQQPKFRCSSLGYLMTDPQSAKDKEAGELGKVAKTYINDVYIRIKYGRKKTVVSKYLEKGISVEDDSIALVSAIHGKMYQKNETNFENEFLTGTPDIVDSQIIDTKSSWDIYTFFKSELTPMYEWQIRGYMWLTGIKSGILAYCLINTPEYILQSEIKKAHWPLINAQEFTTDQVILKRLEEEKKKIIEQIYVNCTFNDIELEKKFRPFQIEYDEQKEKQIETRLKKAIEYYNTLNY